MEVRRIPIASIKVKDRARQDMGDIEELAKSIQEKGLIQPITVNESLRLLAGERRLLAHIHLEKTHIDAIIRPGSDLLDALEIEMIENANRKDMTWHETCSLQKRIFEEQSKRGKWNQTKQAEMLKSSQPQVSRQIKMAEALELLPELSQKATFDEAWKELKSLEEESHKQATAKKQAEAPKQQSVFSAAMEDAFEKAFAEYFKHMTWILSEPPEKLAKIIYKDGYWRGWGAGFAEAEKGKEARNERDNPL